MFIFIICHIPNNCFLVLVVEVGALDQLDLLAGAQDIQVKQDQLDLLAGAQDIQGKQDQQDIQDPRDIQDQQDIQD